MKLVTIPEERFLELIDAERSSESCKSCGPLAQRDRLIDAKDAEIVRLKERISCLDELIAKGKVETAQVEFNRVYKKYEVAAACIGGVENILSTLQSSMGEAIDGALARIIQYHEELDRIEKEVAS